MKKNKIHKGFTLIELLAVIIILGIITLLGTLSISKVMTSSKKESFFLSVQSVIENIEKYNILDASDYCIYDYSVDQLSKTSNIKSMYAIYYIDDEGHKKTAVYAKGLDNVIIDHADFKTLTSKKSSDWSLMPEVKDNNIVTKDAIAVFHENRIASATELVTIITDEISINSEAKVPSVCAIAKEV